MNNIEQIKNNEIKPVVEQLANIKNEDDIYNCMIQIYQAVELALEKHQDPDEKAMIACHKGCKTCCRLNVAVLPVEAICILNHLKSVLSEQDFKSLSGKFHSHYLQCAGLEDEDRIVAGINCIFLNSEGACSIYPVRPLICRSITSSSAEACKESFNSLVFGEEKEILINLFQKILINATFGLICDILEDNGFDNDSHTLAYSLVFFNKNENVKKYIDKY